MTLHVSYPDMIFRRMNAFALLMKDIFVMEGDVKAALVCPSFPNLATRASVS